MSGNKRALLKDIADKTLAALQTGSYTVNNVTHNLSSSVKHSTDKTLFFGPDALSNWSSELLKSAVEPGHKTEISFFELSTLDGARLLSQSTSDAKIGILNFASAKKEGGGFLGGAQAQEESIARSSTLYPSLMTPTAQQFYKLHKRDNKGGYYTHAMIYSPSIVIFREDGGGWTEPLEVDVLTSPAVNAGVARKTLFGQVGGQAEELRIEKAMKERMARILYLFEKQDIRNLVLGSFGTGVFKNNVGMVFRIWADLLAVEGARFQTSFDRVVFAVLGQATYDEGREQFEQRTAEGHKGPSQS